MNLTDARIPTTYLAADTLLADRDDRNIANNTTLVRRGDSIAVRLHSTDVVTYFKDGTIGLHSGGYQTVTTKDRMKRFTPDGVTVYQQDYVWYVVVDRDWDAPVEFEDGMVLDLSSPGFARVYLPA